MRIAGAQIDIAWHDRLANHAKARSFAEEAKAAKADVLIFPEMFPTGFSMDTTVTPEPIDGPTPTLLRELAVQYGMVVVGGFVLKRKDARPQNVSLAVDPSGNDLALYAKIHQISILDENNHYAPGERPMPFDLAGSKAASLICFDLRFPELFRALTDQCWLIVVGASWPAARQKHWDILLKARAVENQCYVVGVNRVGEGGGHLFSGGSAIIDPLGEVLALKRDKEGLVIADIDPLKVTEVRTTMPFLEERKEKISI
jgi:omega-amidase